MRKKFTRPLIIICIILMLLGLLGLSYFGYIKFMKDDSVINISGPLSINYKNGNKLTIKGDKTTNITIINDSDQTSYYYIEFINLKNITNDITYRLEDSKNNVIEDKLNPFNTVVSSYIMLEAGSIENYTLSFTSKSNGIYNLEVNIATENLEVNNFAEVILKNNEVKEKTITKVGEEIATTDEGLIKSLDDNGITYYFRGKVLNNNVKIGNMMFKIVRINGDGTVRLVYDGELDSLQKYYEEDYTFKKSSAYIALDAWYKTNLYEYYDYLSTEKYCNDLSMDDNSYLARNRLEDNNIPSFKCLGDRILSKVGLLTADEIIFAGGSIKEINKDYYLYNESISDSFLMTSARTANDVYYPYVLSSDGKIISSTSGNTYRALRPVVNVNKTVEVSGKGTVNDPYVFTNDK